MKNVGRSFLAEVIRERQSGAFSSFEDFVARMSAHELNKRQVESLIKSGAFDSLGTPRAALLSEYEKIIDIYVKKNRSEEAGQFDLFSLGNAMFGEESPSAPDAAYAYPEMPEMPLRDRLFQEKESMGMYFSGHPFDEYEHHATCLGAVPISEVLAAFNEENPEEVPAYHDRDTVTLAGIVVSRTGKQTRAGAPMAFLKIEDRLGEIELVIFPKVLEKYSYFLAPDAPVAAVGELSVSEDAPPKLLVSKMELLIAGFDGEAEPLAAPRKSYPKKEAAPTTPAAPAKPRVLYLKFARLDGEIFRRVESLLGIFDGAVPVVYYDASAGTYQKETGIAVEPMPHMLAQLRALLGDDAVVLKP